MLFGFGNQKIMNSMLILKKLCNTVIPFNHSTIGMVPEKLEKKKKTTILS